MPGKHVEARFEEAIERDLIGAGGYGAGDRDAFDAGVALFPREVFAFIQGSQPEIWAQLEKEHRSGLEAVVLDSLTKNLADRGMLDVLRHGFKVFGRQVRAAFFRPAHGLNPDVEKQYAANRLTITRQVRFDPASGDSIDVLLALNGLPFATLELKNSLTGQRVKEAMRQYQYDRDPRLPLFQFKRRALVHFAVDTDDVMMTTRLDGRATRFLPFNRGNAGGRGNPPVEGESYKTGYLWREVLERHSVLDILARFACIVIDEKVVSGKKVTAESLLFPRYHQLDAVRRLVAASREEGAGAHYLVQHSAGSGKSNSIAWTAHHLASLHDAEDRKVFDSVVVVTDRRVLDKQLQDTIYQFEHKAGVVEKIDQDSTQLAGALTRGTPIVITTLQKFPFVAEKIEGLPDRRYAVIVDEAHSSMSGEAAASLRQVLGERAAGKKGKGERVATGVADAGEEEYRASPDADEPEEITYEDEIARVMAARGRQPNMSFFAFTATPKAKTLEVFGRPGPGGKPRPFHLYSMRQAIEEGFILDVLRNYTTYKAYWKLVNSTAASAEREVPKQEALKALARFVSLHPHNVAQKTEVIVEHFRQFVGKKVQGKAKGMIVARSRLHAVRFKQAFDRYVATKAYEDLRALVAFSGTVVDPDDGGTYTEVGMNAGIAEKELPTRFATPEFQVLIVANKYQTGFDQPLLCAMYVDRRLDGVQAVQTLSRLNRTHPGKEETFVLDFVNDAETIQEAFQPYYEQTAISETADPYQLERLQHELDEARIWTESEIEAFAQVFYRPAQNLTEREHEELHRHLQPAVDRYEMWNDEEARELWRGKLQAFVRLYAFLSQVMPWTDRELELRYSFGRLLLKRLPRSERHRLDLEGEVDLHSYRLARIGEADIALEKGTAAPIQGATATGTAKANEKRAALGEIIELLNKRFGTTFTERDQLFVEAVIADGKADERVQARAAANTYDNFALSLRETLQTLMIDRMDRNGEMVNRFLDDHDFRKALSDHIARRIYEDLKRAG